MGAAAIPAAIIGSSVIGGIASSSAASKASKAQQQAVNASIAAQQGFYNTTKDQLQPYLDTGSAAASKISQLEGLDGSGPGTIQATLESLPGYQFANQQGLKSVQNSATARGLGVSGASQKAAANYSTGLANQYYNNLLTGIQNTENTGEAAGAALGGVGASTGQSIGDTIVGGGNAKAAADISKGNSIISAAQGVPSALLTQGLLNNITGGGNSQYGAPGSETAGDNAFLNSAWNSAFGQIGGG